VPGALWTRQFGSADWDEATGVAVDPAGNAYVVGLTTGALPGQTHAGDGDAFIVRYGPDGALIRSRQLGTVAEDVASGVAVDATGDAYVVGRTGGALPGQTHAGDEDAFLVRYGPDGTLRWTRQVGTEGEDWAHGVAVDAAGDAYVVGHTRGALPGQTNAGDSDAFIVKYDPDGTLRWTRQLGTEDYDETSGVAVDAAGDAYVVGVTWAPCPAGPAPASWTPSSSGTAPTGR